MGLCLGFSILSGIEVIYFFTLRAFWKFCRKRKLKKKAEHQTQEQNTNSYFQQLLFQKPTSKVISMNPNTIPVYPREFAGKSMWSSDSQGVKAEPVPTSYGGGSWGGNQGQMFYGSNTFVPINNKGMRFYTQDY